MNAETAKDLFIIPLDRRVIDEQHRHQVSKQASKLFLTNVPLVLPPLRVGLASLGLLTMRVMAYCAGHTEKRSKNGMGVHMSSHNSIEAHPPLSSTRQ